MPDRSTDWLAQGEKDLEVARSLRGAGHHEWSCFAAQQAAEKALKAAHLSHLKLVRGHSVREMLARFADVPETLIAEAQVLDTYYIPTRYANGHDAGAPFENYNSNQSEQAIAYADHIVGFARRRMAQSR